MKKHIIMNCIGVVFALTALSSADAGSTKEVKCIDRFTIPSKHVGHLWQDNGGVLNMNVIPMFNNEVDLYIGSSYFEYHNPSCSSNSFGATMSLTSKNAITLNNYSGNFSGKMTLSVTRFKHIHPNTVYYTLYLYKDGEVIYNNLPGKLVVGL